MNASKEYSKTKDTGMEEKRQEATMNWWSEDCHS